MQPATSIFLPLLPSPSCPSQPSLPLISLQVAFFSSPLPAPVPLLLLPFLVPPNPLASPLPDPPSPLSFILPHLLSTPRPAPTQRRAGWVASGWAPPCARTCSAAAWIPRPRLRGWRESGSTRSRCACVWEQTGDPGPLPGREPQAAACIAEDAGPLAPPRPLARGRLLPSVMPRPLRPACLHFIWRVGGSPLQDLVPATPRCPLVSAPGLRRLEPSPGARPCERLSDSPRPQPFCPDVRGPGSALWGSPEAALSPLSRAVLPPVARLSAVQPHPSPASRSPVADPGLWPAAGTSYGTMEMTWPPKHQPTLGLAASCTALGLLGWASQLYHLLVHSF